MSDIANLISVVGFPIAACIGCAFFIKYIIDMNAKTMESIRAEQANINRTMQQAINNNTKALQELIDKLDLCRAIDNDEE